MKEMKRYCAPEMEIVDLKNRLMDNIPLVSNDEPLSIDADLEKEENIAVTPDE